MTCSTTRKMPDGQAADGSGAQGEESWEKRLWSIGKNIAIFLAIQYAMRQFMGGGSSQSKNAPAAQTNEPAPAAQPSFDLGPDTVYPMWPTDTNVDMT